MKIVASWLAFIFAFLVSLCLIPEKPSMNPDFVPVPFQSGAALPESCIGEKRLVVFHPTDGKQIYCSETAWIKTD